MRASSEDHQALTFKKIKHDLPFPSLPPQKYGLYRYSLCLRQVTRLSHTARSQLHPNSFFISQVSTSAPLPMGQGRCNAELRRASGSDGAGGLTDDAALGREAGGNFALINPPPARKWLFNDKHLRPGSVCRNLPLGTSLVHRAQSPEQELVQLETRWGGRGRGRRGGG